MIDIFNKYKIAVYTLIIFTIIGVIVWIIRDYRYFFLFLGIGTLDASTRVIVKQYPKVRQILRKIMISLIGGFLFFWLSLVIGVNFQFPEIFFDAYEGIITGALIQLVVARLILPFFAGNAFCSRACWNGAVFEFANFKRKKHATIPRSNLLAWGYLIALASLAVYVAAFHQNPAADIDLRRQWIIWENIFIIVAGTTLTWLTGSRAYCRMLCPFLTISSLISPFSMLKITPIRASNCNSCMMCNYSCPMLIDVHKFVMENKRINDKTCILCETCVSSCNKNVLEVSTKGYSIFKS